MDCRTLLVAVAAALLIACVDSTGPPDPPSPPEALVPVGPQHLRWADPAPSLFAPRGQDVLEWSVHAAAFAEAVTGNQFSASFWVLGGQQQTVGIDYRSPDGTTEPFLRMDFGESSLSALPDGRPVAEGDSVLITIEVDLSQLVVQFSPTGLVFDPEEQPGLTIWYSAANLDLDGDGDIDTADVQIEQEQLHLWSHRDGLGTWQPVESTESHTEKYFATPVLNLSGYAVSY